jgi:RNA polymerase sigma factor (sigma-70 family)
VYNPVYYPFGYSFFVAEHPCPDAYASDAVKNGCGEEEIAAIRAVLHKLTSLRVVNPTDAEDLVQDTLLTLISKFPGELEKGPLVWSLGILRKKVGNYYRRTQRFTYFSEQNPSTQQSVRDFTIEASPDSAVHYAELQELVEQALESFPASQRRAIELLIAGFNPGEIAELLIPERYQNVINHIHRGRKKLAKELAKYGYGPGAKAGMHTMKRCPVRK